MKANWFKKNICAMLSVVLCLGLLSCSGLKDECDMEEKIDNGEQNEIEVDDYAIINRNNECYIVFKDVAQYENNGQSELATIEFATIEELKEAVTKGKLSDWQKEVIATSFPKNDIGIMSCDFNHLYTPTMPVGGTVSGVSWGGENYSFYLEFSNGVFGYAHYYTEAQYNQIFELEYENYFNKETITVTKNEQISNGEKVATYYSTLSGELMQIRYTIVNDNKTFIVDKTYRINMVDETIITSSWIPSNITMYCVEGGVCYVIDIFGFVEEPTDEWLIQFSMNRYIANNSVIK